MHAPPGDPTPIFELYRGSYATELLTAAVSHLRVFEYLAERPLSLDELRVELGLEPRPIQVLVTALRAMGLVAVDVAGRLELTPLARNYLLSASPFDISGYVGLSSDSPGVLEMVQRLRTNRPAGAEQPDAGAAFIYRDGLESAMEREATARHFTLALAGRARNVAPVLATQYPLPNARRLLDVGGGTGIYSYAYLLQHPELEAVIWDRPEVLKVAAEWADRYKIRARVKLLPGDMFRDPVPDDCDVILLSNILHDWDVPECQQLLKRCADRLRPGGQLLIHDVFLDDDLGGPLPIALYSAALFGFTEGRAYSRAEYHAWLVDAGLEPVQCVKTLVHCGVLVSRRPA